MNIMNLYEVMIFKGFYLPSINIRVALTPN